VIHAESAPNDYERAFAVIAQERPDALFVGSFGPDLYANRQRIVEFAARSRLPMMAWSRDFTEVGGLMSYGVSAADVIRRAAGYVDRILKGARPGDLPVGQPTEFELVINLKTAKALSLTIPPSVLSRADEVIQ
jgi:putative ABC transport system substrate-binding protein